MRKYLQLHGEVGKQKALFVNDDVDGDDESASIIILQLNNM